MAKVSLPAGVFEGIVLCHHIRRAYLCAMAEAADAESVRHAGFRIEGNTEGRRQIKDVRSC